MVGLGSEQHQDKIKEVVKQLNEEGYYAIDINGVAPDGIAYKDGKLYAIEVMGVSNTQLKKNPWSVRSKLERYKMFDDVIFRYFVYERRILTEDEKMLKKQRIWARNLVNKYTEGQL